MAHAGTKCLSWYNNQQQLTMFLKEFTSTITWYLFPPFWCLFASNRWYWKTTQQKWGNVESLAQIKRLENWHIYQAKRRWNHVCLTFTVHPFNHSRLTWTKINWYCFFVSDNPFFDLSEGYLRHLFRCNWSPHSNFGQRLINKLMNGEVGKTTYEIGFSWDLLSGRSSVSLLNMCQHM